MLVETRPPATIPWGSLTLSGSTLYGMTEYGGANKEGTIFSVPVTGGTPTILFSFDGTNGSHPRGGLTFERLNPLRGGLRGWRTATARFSASR